MAKRFLVFLLFALNGRGFLWEPYNSIPNSVTECISGFRMIPLDSISRHSTFTLSPGCRMEVIL